MPLRLCGAVYKTVILFENFICEQVQLTECKHRFNEQQIELRLCITNTGKVINGTVNMNLDESICLG